MIGLQFNYLIGDNRVFSPGKAWDNPNYNVSIKLNKKGTTCVL